MDKVHIPFGFSSIVGLPNVTVFIRAKALTDDIHELEMQYPELRVAKSASAENIFLFRAIFSNEIRAFEFYQDLQHVMLKFKKDDLEHQLRDLKMRISDELPSVKADSDRRRYSQAELDEELPW